MGHRFRSGFIAFLFVGLGWTGLCSAQAPQPTPVPDPEPRRMASAGERLPGQRLWGTNISGMVVDQSGAVIAGARVALTSKDQSLGQEVQSGTDGEFSFVNIPPGPFQLTITSAGFAAQTFSGTLHLGEVYTVPPLTLAIATASAEVQVGVSQREVAEAQIKVEEKQRVLGLIPNFYVSYVPNAAPLTPKQKFQLAWKSVVDPVTFLMVAGGTGVEQAQDVFNGYGQGAQGYAKRFGAGYGDTITGTFIGGAILPSLLKQDPRYFYKGTGSAGSRILYAIANSVICKGDDKRWQFAYSGIIGGLAAGGISNLYYPANNRGAGLVFENTAIGVGENAVSNLFQEFLFRKLTPKVPNSTPTKP